jgi:glycosyltransferase involved in cell wall biosynthesis
MTGNVEDAITSNSHHPSRPNIAVMEFLYHWDYFITTVDLLNHLANVFLIVGEHFKNYLEQNYRFKISDFNNLVVSELNWLQIDAYIKKNQISKIFIPTIQGFEFTYAFSEFNSPVPYYFTIHNFDLWLGKRPFLSSSQDQGFVSQINRVYLLMCQKIIRSSAGIITIDDNLKDHIAPMIQNKEIFAMPWKVNRSLLSTPLKNTSKDHKIVFTVPASVDCIRRNYGVVLESFKPLFKSHHNINLILLGRPVNADDQEVIKQSRQINDSLGRQAIEYFDDFVHQNIYNDRLKHTDFFILPLKNLHIIGTYKSSAAMYDAILAGRPILVPEKMSFSSNFIARYGNGFIVYDDLKQTIEEILATPTSDLKKYLKASIANANTFFIENQIKVVAKKIFNKETS